MEMEWISVNDRLPENDEDVLCRLPFILGGHQMIVANYQEKRWYDYKGDNLNQYCSIITHWMPLPEPPQEKQNDQ